MKTKLMPMDIFKKIIDEVACEEFSSFHDIQLIELGENGDAFLNRNRNLRYPIGSIMTKLLMFSTKELKLNSLIIFLVLGCIGNRILDFIFLMDDKML